MQLVISGSTKFVNMHAIRKECFSYKISTIEKSNKETLGWLCCIVLTCSPHLAYGESSFVDKLSGKKKCQTHFHLISSLT